MNVLTKYKIYQYPDDYNLSTLILNIKYKINNKFTYNKIKLSVPDAITDYCTNNNIEIPADLSELDYFEAIKRWNIVYKASLDIINKIGLENIVKDLIVNDIESNHESDIAISTYNNLVESIVTKDGYKTINFQMDKKK